MTQEKVSIKVKEEEVKKLTDLCKESRSLIISPILNLPASLIQDLRRKFKDKLKIKVIKRSLIERILKNLGINPETLDENLRIPSALIFSKLDLFEIASLFHKNRIKSFLKPNQIVPTDLYINKGPTNLPPVVIADLSKAGLKVGVEKGKVVIKEKKIIKKGEKISEALADALQKLEIKPLKLGFKIEIGIDLKNKKIYKNIGLIEKEELEAKLSKANSNAFNLALNLNWINKKTINILIQKAFIHAQNLNKLIEK